MPMFMRPRIKFMEYYAKCSDHDWKRSFDSRDGLFRVVFRQPPKQIIGPTFTKNRQIVGDLWAMEVSAFYGSASDEQVKLYDLLCSKNVPRSREYLLHVINALERWKADVKHLQGFLHYFKEDEMRKEEGRLSHFAHQDVIIRNVPSILREHFPEHFARIDRDYSNIRQLVQDIEVTIKDLHSAEDFIEAYLSKLKRELHFLFD